MSINSQYEWLKFGQEKGWASNQFCLTHDGPPTTAEEDAEWEEGLDPCCFSMVRSTQVGVKGGLSHERCSEGPWHTV